MSIKKQRLLNSHLSTHFCEKRFMIYPKLHSKRLLLLLLGTCFLCSNACSPPEFEAPKKPKPPQRSYSVSLPPSIDLEAEIPPLQNPDKTYRIDGLQMKAKQFLDQELSITGYITEISPCTNRAGDTCPKPYLYISDRSDDSDIKLRVADMPRKKLRRFRVGQKYIFTGKLADQSKSGYANSNGILLLKEYTKVK